MEYSNRKEITEFYYVDLDTMFDTKLSILKAAFPKFLKEYLKTEEYWKRNTDSFFCNGTILDNDTFSILYKKRNNDILKTSYLTSIPYILAKQIQEHYREYDCGKCLNRPGIMVNIFPYKLSEEDCKSLKLLISRYLEIPIETYFVRIPYSELDLLTLCDNNVTSMIMNDGMDWIESIDKNWLLRTDISHLKIITPKINNSKCEVTDELFKSIEAMYKNIVDFEFLSASYFSPSLNPGEEEITGMVIETFKEDLEFQKKAREELDKIIKT